MIFRWEEKGWVKRVSKSIKVARSGEDCRQFSCSPVSKVQKLVRTYLLGDPSEVKNASNAPSTPTKKE